MPQDARVDPALVEAIVRGWRWFELLASGQVGSFTEIAEAEGVTRCYVARLIPLAFLAPDIVENILSGAQPVDLTTDELAKRIDLPLDWAEQRGGWDSIEGGSGESRAKGNRSTRAQLHPSGAMPSGLIQIDSLNDC